MSLPFVFAWNPTMSTNGDITALARPEIRSLKAYVPAIYKDGLVRLNANEAPWTSGTDDSARGLNRYPPARPSALTAALASHYDVTAEQVFVTRGSSEAIDLLIRCFCRPGLDEIVICPPTFGMYKVYADIQGASVREIPLIERIDGLQLDTQEIIERWTGVSRLVFVTTPNNPTGGAIAIDDIQRLANALTGRGIVVIDAAYIEFATSDELMVLANRPNIVILRTLSKAYGLAGARCGALIAHPDVVSLVARVMPPYSMPTPSMETALAALVEETHKVMPERIARLIEEREQLAAALDQLPCVVRVWPSDANFLLVEFTDPTAAIRMAEDNGFLLRDFSNGIGTENCLRITVGGESDNRELLSALQKLTSSGATP
ncbi:MAG: histidinol-phosphate transaminase [Woeseiaceae bacterium]